MREYRPPGSVRGACGDTRPYRDTIPASSEVGSKTNMPCCCRAWLRRMCHRERREISWKERVVWEWIWCIGLGIQGDQRELMEARDPRASSKAVAFHARRGCFCRCLISEVHGGDVRSSPFWRGNKGCGRGRLPQSGIRATFGQCYHLLQCRCPSPPLRV